MVSYHHLIKLILAQYMEYYFQLFFSYVIIRGMKNAILYFIPREECYVEDENLIYRRTK